MLGPCYPLILCVRRYCLSHSPVPIIVVRPEEKVRKTMAKRRADPKRGSHFEKCVSLASVLTVMLMSILDSLHKARTNTNGPNSVPLVTTMTQ